MVIAAAVLPVGQGRAEANVRGHKAAIADIDRAVAVRGILTYERRNGLLDRRVLVVTGKRTVRHVLFDANYWKCFVHSRLAVPVGDPGCLSLFSGHRRQVPADMHRLLAEHLTSEYRVKTEGRGRTVDEWKLRAHGRDNHWFDCLVGAAVAASMEGALLPGTGEKKKPRRVVSFAELRAEARARRADMERKMIFYK